jgi:hypothetical protein
MVAWKWGGDAVSSGRGERRVCFASSRRAALYHLSLIFADHSNDQQLHVHVASLSL